MRGYIDDEFNEDKLPKDAMRFKKIGGVLDIRKVEGCDKMILLDGDAIFMCRGVDVDAINKLISHLKETYTKKEGVHYPPGVR